MVQKIEHLKRSRSFKSIFYNHHLFLLVPSTKAKAAILVKESSSWQ